MGIVYRRDSSQILTAGWTTKKITRKTATAVAAAATPVDNKKSKST